MQCKREWELLFRVSGVGLRWFGRNEGVEKTMDTLL